VSCTSRHGASILQHSEASAYIPLTVGAPDTKVSITLGDMDGYRRVLDVGAIGIPLKTQPLIEAQNTEMLRVVPRRDLKQRF
jgi:hypothetical protein